MKKAKKMIAAALCCLMILPFLTACIGSLSYVGGELENGKVGIEYFGDVAFADGTDSLITYTLKEGSSLPDGLELLEDGSVIGIPAAMTDGAQTFTVIASAEKAKAVEADFSIAIERGAITYAGNDSLRIAVGRPANLSIATASGSPSISYALNATDAENMPSAPTAADPNEKMRVANGIIVGTPSTVGEIAEFRVTASARDCASMTANFKLEIVNPWLEYRGRSIQNGRVGEPYAYELPIPAGIEGDEDAIVKYEITTGDLPQGLSMTSDGLIHGKPEMVEELVGRKQSFTVKVTANSNDAVYTPAEADFSITVRAPYRNEDSPAVEPGTIAFEGGALEEGFIGEIYSTSGIAVGKSTNMETVTYSVATGSSLPAGFTLYPTGLLRVSRETGVSMDAFATDANGNKTSNSFSITASAEGCPSVTKTFTLQVNEAPLRYADVSIGVLRNLDDENPDNDVDIDVPVVGTPYSASVAEAYAPKGAMPSITYKSDSMPAGLVLNTNGTISGTPTKSARSVTFTVTASAEGFSDATAEVTIVRIREAVTTVSNGKFEAEFVDLTGKNGAGWSGSARAEELVEPNSDAPASTVASGGYFVGWLHCPIWIDFRITSSQAVTGASLAFALGSELTGAVTFTSSDLNIIVNGTAQSFTSFSLPGNEYASFTLISFGNINLKEGENLIRFRVNDNMLWGGSRTGGPGIDFMQIGNVGSATLSWQPCTYNPEHA